MDSWFISLINQFDGYGIALFVLITTIISGLLSSVFGLEREFQGRQAGLKTHVLVSIGCCLLMTICVFAIQNLVKGTDYKTLTYDASRIAAGILGGVGFIGAGAIIKSGLNIQGLTTAATLWLSAAIGMAVGCGFILEAIIATGVAFIFLVSLKYFEKFIENRSPKIVINVLKTDDYEEKIQKEAASFNLVIKNMNIISEKNIDGIDVIEVLIQLAYHSDKKKFEAFSKRLQDESNALNINKD